MKVEVEHAKLSVAVRRLEDLAETIRIQARRASDASPIVLPPLFPLAAKVQWLEAQVPDLRSLAALALLLDTEGSGNVSFTSPGTVWDPQAMFDQVVADRFGPDFAASTGLTDEKFTQLMTTFGSIGQDLPSGSDVMSPTELRTMIVADPDLARALTELTLRSGEGAEGALASLMIPMATAVGGSHEAVEQRRSDARALFEELPGDQASILAMMFPAQVGAMRGVPFKNVAEANTVRIVVALDDERASHGDLEDRHQQNQSDGDLLGRNNDDLEGLIDSSGKRIALYESILDTNRQIVMFDPSADGAMAELHGPIDANTENVGVMVPGTGNDLSSFDGNALRSQTFRARQTDGSLSMITWMGGDLPDNIAADAPNASYAADLGPKLAGFSADVNLEIELSGAPGPKVTYAGHSYGGAVVGTAEKHGLQADRVLHVESAGMGHDIEQASDLPASQARVDRYSMTAPGDPIGYTQGVQPSDSVVDYVRSESRGSVDLADVGHGADPDTFDGTTRLHTGNRADGSYNSGAAAHSDVFQEGSEAWNNQYEVFVGGDIETYRSPEYDHTVSPIFPFVQREQTGWDDDGEKENIE